MGIQERKRNIQDVGVVPMGMWSKIVQGVVAEEHICVTDAKDMAIIVFLAQDVTEIATFLYMIINV